MNSHQRQPLHWVASPRLCFLAWEGVHGLYKNSLRLRLRSTVADTRIAPGSRHQHFARSGRATSPTSVRLVQRAVWLCQTAGSASEQTVETISKRDALLERCHQARQLSEHQKRLFHKLCDLLLERNQQVNLTAIRTVSDVYEKHFGDSLRLIDVIDQLPIHAEQHESTRDKDAGLRLLDLGSGCGFPGLALAIARPSWQLVLLDSTRKKCDWLREARSALQLSNVVVEWDRAELAGHRPEMRECFDLVVARAVARLPVLAELALPFVRVGGFFLAPKEYIGRELPSSGAEWSELASAMHAIKLNGGLYERTVPMAPSLVQGDQTPAVLSRSRVVVLVRKQNKTPKAYPRAPGRPQAKPL
ncbi:hypothetical protein CCYA_CCYA18G4613 [Cyanidiococcus yangmingshanensis]|nr:hypothetical protein CCYA_CCYA18G4613 [Cyanidiococcus yangmingshanensis]